MFCSEKLFFCRQWPLDPPFQPTFKQERKSKSRNYKKLKLYKFALYNDK